MRPRTYLAGIVAVCATILVSAGLLAQENPYGEMSPEQQAMMQAWTEYGTPGEQHEMLANRVGQWTVAGKMWHSPDAEPMPFTATSTIKSVMDGRYFLEKVEGPGFMGGPPFEGRSIFGYDNLTKTYFSFWFDNMMTGVARYEGTSSGDGRTIHYTVDTPDPMSGKYKQGRAVDTMIDEDHGVFTMYDTTADGDEYVTMELTITRKGAEPTSKPQKKRGS
jgi:hypothetical protein